MAGQNGSVVNAPSGIPSKKLVLEIWGLQVSRVEAWLARMVMLLARRLGFLLED